MINYLKPQRNSFFNITMFISLFLASISLAKGQEYIQQVQTIINNTGSPGIQLSFEKGDQKLNISLGVKKYGTADSILPSTKFQAASLTKVVAAYAFFKLMDRGLINLDTPLLHYYPYDRLANVNDADKITARMVLTHRSGLLNWEGDVPSEKWRKSPLTLQFTPGTDYMYSGEGFYFLQETLEFLTGKTFQQIIEEEVFIPFQMNNSNILWTDSMENETAYGHREQNNPRNLGKYRKSNAAYTLYCNAIDYMTFIQKAILNGEGLKKETHKLMLSRAAEAKKDKISQPEDQFVPCALGLRMQINEAGTAYWHTGSNPGFRCFFITYPQTNETLVAFMNTDTGFSAMKELMKLFLSPNQTFWAYDWRHGELD